MKDEGQKQIEVFNEISIGKKAEGKNLNLKKLILIIKSDDINDIIKVNISYPKKNDNEYFFLKGFLFS